MTEAERDEKIRTTVDHICQRWASADRALLRHVFPLLAEGRPVPTSQIADATGTTMPVVESALVSGRAGRDVQGRVTELFGVMLQPTFHRVEVGGVCLFTCCAVIAQMVPGLVGKKATIQSVDPESRRIVRVTLDPVGNLKWDPPGAVGCLVETNLEGVLENVGAAFCSHVNHFVNREFARRFVAANPLRYILEMPDFNSVAVRLLQRIWV